MVAHRIVWSVPIAGAVLISDGRTADIKGAMRSPRTIAMGALTAALITVNWGTYVWAIADDRTVETALGYYINPLFNVVLGAVLLGERLSRRKSGRSALAAVAVTVLTVRRRRTALGIAGAGVSCAAYGFFKQDAADRPSQGFLLEVLLLSEPALGYIVWLIANGQGHFVSSGADRRRAAARLRPGHRGAAAPVCVRRQALAALDDRDHAIYRADHRLPDRGLHLQGAVRHHHAVAFALIWAALVIYSWSMLAGARKARAFPG